MWEQVEWALLGRNPGVEARCCATGDGDGSLVFMDLLAWVVETLKGAHLACMSLLAVGIVDFGGFRVFFPSHLRSSSPFRLSSRYEFMSLRRYRKQQRKTPAGIHVR